MAERDLALIVDDVMADAVVVVELSAGGGGRLAQWGSERIKEVKLGDGLLHFPLGTLGANRAWQTGRWSRTT